MRQAELDECISLSTSRAIFGARKASTRSDQLTGFSLHWFVLPRRTFSGQRLAQAHAWSMLLILVDEDNARRLKRPLNLRNCLSAASYFVERCLNPSDGRDANASPFRNFVSDLNRREPERTDLPGSIIATKMRGCFWG